ncbi:MAG: nuclear transport factor 2 family protein [Oscillospiraceae bacterium]|nr:nuclear transport factor 2 family protein [Oscillospiraceae bacterium]
MTNKETVRRLYECLGQRDRAGALALLTEDYAEHENGSTAGAERLMEINEELLRQEADRYEVVLLFADGEDGVAAYTKIKAGDRTTARTADLYRMRDGRISERWSIRQSA